jgi:hypothetical protein
VSLPLILRSLWLLNILLCVGLVLRLLQLKLAGTYKGFFFYLLFIVVRSAVMWPLDLASRAYILIWKLTQPIAWVLYTLIVLELCSLIFKEYRGIQVLGRRVVYGCLAVAILVSMLILTPVWRNSGEPILSTPRFLMVERGIDSALVLLLLLLLVFLALLPIPLSRNVVIHSVLYAAFFMASSLGIFIVNMTRFESGRIISTCLMGVSSLCLIAWIALLSREGESKLAAFRKPLPTAYEQMLVDQLSSINATLLRASAKVDSARLTTK